MNFTNITKKTKPEENFWELNPQIQYLTPFNKLKDEFKDSSQHMWAIFFMSDPDEDINKFYRYDLEKRKEQINNFYSKIKWEDPLFIECLESYPFECLNSIQRSLKDELDSLKDRTRLIRHTKLTLDYTDPDTGRTIKGTTAQIDTMRAKSEKIYEQLEKAQNKFFKQKDEEIRVRGGRAESFSEKGLV
jgi:hypothetical protein